MRIETTKTRTITDTIAINLPYWVELVLSGRKIDAIKELRNITYRPGETNLSLHAASVIVDSITSEVVYATMD